jgi:hypothetical protein
VTIPPVPIPNGGRVRLPLDFTLKPGWSFDRKRRMFVSATGETFSPARNLPRGSRIVYKVPTLAAADASTLSEAERALQRYMQLIPPEGTPADALLDAVRAWPSVEDVHVGPNVSLPRP